MAGSPRVQLSLKGRLLSEVPFAGAQLRIGRMRENDVVVNNLAVSRFHAVLKREGEGYLLEDLGSENGTLLNGERVTGAVAMKPDDVVQLGKYELRISVGSGPAIAAPPKSKPSDAWDSSQTFLALGEAPKAAPPEKAPVKSPVASPSPLAAAVDPAEAAPELGAAAHVEEDLPLLDAVELGDEHGAGAEAAQAEAPDPGGVFAFGEDDVASAEAPSEPHGGVAADPAPPASNLEHTSLFDFGGPDAADAQAAERAEDEIPADFDEAPAASPSPSASEASSKLHAGVIVQRDGKLHLLRAWEAGELCAGRAPECEIVLSDAGVSRRHAVFAREGDRYSVRDLGSVNGIYVNGQRTKQHVLAVGDVVRIESFELTFVLDHSPIGSEVSGPTAAPSQQSEGARATQFSLEAPALEQPESFDLGPVAADPTATTEMAEAPDITEQLGDGFEVLPPADDPLSGDVPTAEPVSASELPESDLVSADGFDDDGEKISAAARDAQFLEVAAAGANARASNVGLRLWFDASQLSPRAREALATLEEEGALLAARVSFERE